jgi:trigger factor
MEIRETERNGLRRGYNVVVAAAEVERQVARELQTLGKRVKIPGFRPGKIPVQMLRQRYGASATGEVLQRAARDASREVLKRENLIPALAPDVKVEHYAEGGDLTLAISLELMPEIPEFDLSGVQIERPVVQVSDEDVAETMGVVAERHRRLKERKAGEKAREGDVVVIDFTGSIDGVPFEGGVGKNYHLELGSGQFIPGFEEQLIGVKAGEERTVSVPFPAEYHKRDLAGKDAEFAVHVHKVSEPELPEINEAFAQEIGFESLDGLKAVLRAQLERDYAALARNQMKKALFDQLDTLCRFDVPEKMVEMEFDSIWKQHEGSVGAAESKKEEETTRKEYRAIAERRVRLGIFLSDLSRREKITVTQEELARAVQQQASLYPGQERKIFELYRDHPEYVNELRGPILEEKAVDALFARVRVEDREISAAALLKNDVEEEQ